MKKLVTTTAIFAALAGASVHATPIRLDGSETNLQQVVNNLTLGGVSSVDVVNEQYALDEGWQINSIFGAQGRIVMELAGYAGVNSLGIYDIYNPNVRVQLFSGAASAGSTTSFDIGYDGTVFRNDMETGATFTTNLFGFYLNTPAGLWFSQGDLNADRADHMVAYQGVGDHITGGRTWGPDQFLLAWEDLASSSWDQDYNDFVLFVRGVNGVQVPEPGVLGLLGLAIASVGFFGRRRQQA
jgi:hypothetical protein